MVHQQKWYVVIVGRDVGVFPSWIEAGPKTKGIPGGAIFQSFLSEEEARRAFEAAKARGEVKAHPIDGTKSIPKSGNALMSPLGTETSLLMAPPEVKKEVVPTALQTPLFRARLRADQLRQALRESTDSSATPLSPPTGVTQYVPLYAEDESPPGPVRRPSPHVTLTSSSSRGYPDFPSDCQLTATGMGTWEINTPGHEASSRDSRTIVTSYSNLQSSDDSEGHMPMPPRREPPSSRSIGVKYRSLDDLDDTESIDSRIWLPVHRVFDPARVKPRPVTRPSSLAKSPLLASSYETAAKSPHPRSQISFTVSPFVRTDRGRPSRLIPSLSLPVLPNRQVESDLDCLNSASLSISSLGHEPFGNGKGEKVDRPVSDELLVERPLHYASDPRRMDGRSHVQLVPREGRNGQSVITVHCPSDCAHETCYHKGSAPMIDLAEDVGPRYVDACVSPIITGKVECTGNPIRDCSRAQSLSGEDDPYTHFGLTKAPHVSCRSLAPDADVRSPIVKGTMVPMTVAETLFARPSPLARVANMQNNGQMMESYACISI
ncbi:hypothetical protein PAXRUDRAFT_828823, partial [Paxillus rubicundulus Ve08.2h10]